MPNNWTVDTDDYDLYGQGDTPNVRQGSPTSDNNEPYYFPMSTIEKSMMDMDPNNTGPTNDFWTDYPITIDINGYIFYNGQNTGINVRGPAGASHLSFDELTPAQKATLKGEPGIDGINGTNGVNGTNGKDGLDAYQLWLADNGWSDHPEEHPHSEFYAYLANIQDSLIKAGTGGGSLILNYKGLYNTASGIGSLASGYRTNASGNYSFTTGNNTVAANPYQVAIGIYNKTEANSILEIGNGSEGSRSNALWLSKTGNLTVAGEIKDGNNNTLSAKVDKVSGKGLSTEDFTTQYKNFLDNYTVDTSLNTSSLNPVTNAAIANAINDLAYQNGKPNQTQVSSDDFFSFFHPYSLINGTLSQANFTTALKLNPSRNILTNNNNTIDDNAEYCLLYGNNLTTNYSYQTIIGRNNLNIENDLFEIGNGSGSTYKNAFRVNKNGNSYAEGTFIDGEGNALNAKQDILSYDEVPTQNSDNLIKSGDLYDYLVAHGFDPDGGIILPQVDILQNQVRELTAQVQFLTNIVNSLTNPRMFIDDTYTYKTYYLGVDKDDLYIKLLSSTADMAWGELGNFTWSQVENKFTW